MEVGAMMESDEWGGHSANCQTSNGMFGPEETMEGAVHEYTRCCECGGHRHMAP